MNVEIPPELAAVLRGMLAAQRFAVLSTQGEDGPYTNLVAFASAEGLARLIFATPRKSRKYRNLERDARVALLIDDCTNEAGDLEHATAITVLGTAREVSGQECQAFQALYLARHPYLGAFLATEGTVLFSIDVSRYIVVAFFQDVREIDLRGG